MSRLSTRVSITLAAIVVVMLSSRPADAQVFSRQSGGLLNDLNTGVWYDRANQAKAERQLQSRLGKLRRDVEQGNPAAADYDVRRIDNLQHRIQVDEWLIRYNSCQQRSYYPYPVTLDPMSYCAIAQYRTPPRPPDRR